MLQQENLLIIFYKNPEEGKVKTRLAATVGNHVAVKVYKKLVEHTAAIVKTVNITKRVYYAEVIRNTDSWSETDFEKKLQSNGDLGTKMKQAFKDGFMDGYSKVCIIGTDCLELTASIITNAFERLNKNDFVLGPAKDGGYYLLGMNQFDESIFDNKNWSTHTVLHDTVHSILANRKNYALLPILSDVDAEADLPENYLQNL